jgi:hypothetical protein
MGGLLWVLLTPKVKSFFRLNFVEDILAIGCMLKLLSCFYSSRKFLVLILSRDWKNRSFRWFGRAPSVLINHRKRSVSSDKWSISKASNHRKGLNGQKEGSCFRTSQMSSFTAMIRSSNRRMRASWEVMSIREFQPKGPKLLRVIHCKKSFSNLRQAVIDRDGCTDSSPSSVAETFIILAGHSFIIKRKVLSRSPRIAGNTCRCAILFSTDRDLQILVPLFGQIDTVAPNSASVSNQGKHKVIG